MNRMPERLKGELPEEMAGARRLAQIRHADQRAKEETDRPGWNDSELFAPLSEWDRSDREGKVGKRMFVLPGGRLYRERYDLIDWSR